MRPAPPAQHAIAAALLDPCAPVPAGLVAWNGSDVSVRFAVHRNNVVASLIGVLRDTFPVVVALVGDAFFDAMAREHVDAHPPRSPVMGDYGAAFAGWLAGFAPAAALPYLPDVARLEWMRWQAQHAADADAIDPQALALRLHDPDALDATALALHPSLRWLRSAHPAVSLWRAHQLDATARDAALAGIDLGTPQAALVLRPHDEVLVVPLAAADADLVHALAAGHGLGAAARTHPDASTTRVLATLLQHGAVVGLSPARSPTDGPP